MPAKKKAQPKQPIDGERVQIKVCMVEFVVGGNTLWVHSKRGGTVLRIKVAGPITVETGCKNPVSHADFVTSHSAHICLSDDYVLA